MTEKLPNINTVSLLSYNDTSPPFLSKKQTVLNMLSAEKQAKGGGQCQPRGQTSLDFQAPCHIYFVNFKYFTFAVSDDMQRNGLPYWDFHSYIILFDPFPTSPFKYTNLESRLTKTSFEASFNVHKGLFSNCWFR